MSNITTLLQAAGRAEPGSVDRLFVLLYDDLRRLARSRLRRSNGITSLNTTGLVHESYLKFLKADGINAEDRPHFLAYAATVMRSIVVDLIRNRMAEKNGGDVLRITLDTDIAESTFASEADVIRVHEALEELAKIDMRLVKVVEMRYFAGLEMQEIAAALDVTTRTVTRDWEKAKFFLFRALQ